MTDSGAQVQWESPARPARRRRALAGAGLAGVVLLAVVAAGPGDSPKPGPQPLAGTWRTVAAEAPRDNPSADWTGARLLVWGGAQGRHVSTGAAYDPGADAWTTIDAAPVAGRQNHVSAWTGSELLVWGGAGLDALVDGAAYDPSTGAWRLLPEAPLGSPHLTVAAWTGEEWLVVSGPPEPLAAAYDPAVDAWRPLPQPPPHGHRAGAVWTGEELLVVSDALHGTVVRYDPASATWRTGSDIPSPLPTYGVEVAWTGTELLVWGGAVDAPVSAGWAYHPADDEWRPLPEPWFSGTLMAAGSAWSGEHWFVLGDGGDLPAVGAYEPASDRWLALPEAPGGTLPTGPLAWTGDEVVLWSMHGEALAFRPVP